MPDGPLIWSEHPCLLKENALVIPMKLNQTKLKIKNPEK